MKHPITISIAVLVAIATIFVLTPYAQADSEKTISVDYRYEMAANGGRIRGESQATLPNIFGETDLNVTGLSVTDHRIKRTLFVANVAQTLISALKNYENVCKDLRPIPLGDHLAAPRMTIIPIPEPNPIPLPDSTCVPQKKAIGDQLMNRISLLDQELQSMAVVLQDKSLYKLLDISRGLAKNMKEAKQEPYPYFERIGGPNGGIRFASIAGPLNLTGGGAQDFAFFKKLVTDGMVPSSASLTSEGLMSEFDLSLSPTACLELICVNPAVAYEGSSKKLYVQIGMGSNMTAEQFKRRPLNLSIVVDISGSMSATDNTEKSRLEWAKDAIVNSIKHLGWGDYLSVVVFDTESEILIPTTHMQGTEELTENLLEIISALKTKGSTNLEAGLRDGFELVSENFKEGYENRVILISDAGLNMGVTNESNLLQLITDFATEKIGLTAIGLGENFNQEFIHNITMSRGGNYLFVHSGEKMFEYFEAFDYLVTPVAYDFKVKLNLDGLSALHPKLIKTYGVPARQDEPHRALINIETLFFSKAGGAILLEYQLDFK